MKKVKLDHRNIDDHRWKLQPQMIAIGFKTMFNIGNISVLAVLLVLSHQINGIYSQGKSLQIFYSCELQFHWMFIEYCAIEQLFYQITSNHAMYNDNKQRERESSIQNSMKKYHFRLQEQQQWIVAFETLARWHIFSPHIYIF